MVNSMQLHEKYTQQHFLANMIIIHYINTLYDQCLIYVHVHVHYLQYGSVVILTVGLTGPSPTEVQADTLTTTN